MGSLVSWRVLKKEIEEALFLVVMVLASAHLEGGGERGRDGESTGERGKGKGMKGGVTGVSVTGWVGTGKRGC